MQNLPNSGIAIIMSHKLRLMLLSITCSFNGLYMSFHYGSITLNVTYNVISKVHVIFFNDL